MYRYNSHFIKAFMLIVFMLSTFVVFAQNPYELHWKKEIPLLAGGGLGQLLSVKIIVDAIQPLTLEEIEALDRNDINGFDRGIVDEFSAKSRNQSDVFLYSSAAYPFLLLLDKKTRQDILPLTVMTVETVLVNGALTTMVKGLRKRPRPFLYNPEVDLEEKQTRNAQLSFYSGHTSNVAALSFFTAKVFSDYNPDSKWKPVVWSVAAFLPAATGYLRAKGGKHFPTDVITGYIAGGLVGYLIPHFHKKKKKNQDQKLNLSLLTEADKIGFVLTW